MNTIMKSSRIPTFSSLLEDFWSTDNGFKNAFTNSETLPAVNIKENEKSFEIEVAAPGFQKQDFKVDIDNNGLLTISAETRQELAEEKANYTRREFSYSSFSRSFNLPENIKQDEIKARYEDGVLHLTMGKSEATLPAKKMISVD
jgi:HSP20 family protein